MGFKPQCPRCGSRRRRNKKLRIYFCQRCGVLPNGRFLDTTGRPTTPEERMMICDRVSKLREELESK
jgi:ribosomal protein L37AE/L43A